MVSSVQLKGDHHSFCKFFCEHTRTRVSYSNDKIMHVATKLLWKIQQIQLSGVSMVLTLIPYVPLVDQVS